MNIRVSFFDSLFEKGKFCYTIWEYIDIKNHYALTQSQEYKHTSEQEAKGGEERFLNWFCFHMYLDSFP